MITHQDYLDLSARVDNALVALAEIDKIGYGELDDERRVLLCHVNDAHLSLISLRKAARTLKETP